MDKKLLTPGPLTTSMTTKEAMKFVSEGGYSDMCGSGHAASHYKTACRIAWS